MRKIRKVSAIFLFVILFINSFSCSLKYGENVNTESVVPEFVFDNVELKKYENKELKTQVKCEKLEQYKDSSETYAYKINFSAFDDYLSPETVGACDYLAADTDKEIYTLYNNIEVESKKEKSKFFANMLRWNSKTEQLVSNRDDEVVIQKEDTVIKGKGFSASGITKTFRFTGLVSGDIKTKEQNGEEEKNTELSESKNSAESETETFIEKTTENNSIKEKETANDDTAVDVTVTETVKENAINAENENNTEVLIKNESDVGNINFYEKQADFNTVAGNVDNGTQKTNKKSIKSSKTKKSARKRK